MTTTAKKYYNHRVGLPAYICFDFVSETENPTVEQLTAEISQHIIDAVDDLGGFSFDGLDNGYIDIDIDTVSAVEILDTRRDRGLK